MRPFLLALTLLAAQPALALDITALTPSEREAFRAQVRAYLLDTPEVLEEALHALQTRDYTDAANADLAKLHANADALFHDPLAFSMGSSAPEVTIVAFVDYANADCAGAITDLRAMLAEDPSLRLVIREAPQSAASALAAGFALATRQVMGDAAYLKAQDALFAAPGPLDAAALKALSDRLGFDTPALLARMSAPDILQAVASGPALSHTLDLGPPPAFVVENTMVRGYLPKHAMRKIIQQMRDKP